MISTWKVQKTTSKNRRSKILYLSSCLCSPKYHTAADNLFTALEANGVKYDLLPGAKDIWMRDFMPVRRKDGKYVSFRYEPSYLKDVPQLRTDFRRDISGQFWAFDSAFGRVVYSDINLDGGNIVFSPSREKVIVSERFFSENPGWERVKLVRKLEELLLAQVILIPSLPEREDMTGHADGMVRFLDEHTVLGNDTPRDNELEQRIKEVLEKKGIRVIDFPYDPSSGISAEGCYLNFLQTHDHIFLPIFGRKMDGKAIRAAEELFTRRVVPVQINGIAREGGCLNCISWEIDPRDTAGYREGCCSVVTCPICSSETLDLYHICPRCGWEYDSVTEDAGFSGANHMTLGEYKKQWYLRCGKESQD